MIKRLRRAWRAFWDEPLGGLRYGDDKTWQDSGEVNIETDHEGDVVAAWFRCITLPFTQTRVDPRRAACMRQWPIDTIPRIRAIVIEERD